MLRQAYSTIEVKNAFSIFHRYETVRSCRQKYANPLDECGIIRQKINIPQIDMRMRTHREIVEFPYSLFRIHTAYTLCSVWLSASLFYTDNVIVSENELELRYIYIYIAYICMYILQKQYVNVNGDQIQADVFTALHNRWVEMLMLNEGFAWG